MAERIEHQIEYPLLGVEGWIACGEWDPWHERCPGQRRGDIVGAVVPDLDEGGRARPRSAVIFWVGGRIQDAETNGPHAWAAPHEIFHLFGFNHHPDVDPSARTRGGLFMSEQLTRWTASPEMRPDFHDIDALRCIFPEGEP